MANTEKETMSAVAMDAALGEPSKEAASGEAYEVPEFIVDEQMDNHLVRKIDRYLMPLMVCPDAFKTVSWFAPAVTVHPKENI
jgi:hypothetical protein